MANSPVLEPEDHHHHAPSPAAVSSVMARELIVGVEGEYVDVDDGVDEQSGKVVRHHHHRHRRRRDYGIYQVCEVRPGAHCPGTGSERGPWRVTVGR